MAKPWQWASPDTRLRHIAYAREREQERADRLDEQDNQRLLNIQTQMETEQARGADLDRRDSVQEEMRFEQARGAELDRRDRERPPTPPVSEWMPQRGRQPPGQEPIPDSPSGLAAGLRRNLSSDDQKKLGLAFSRYRETGLADLERTNQRRAALGDPPWTEEDVTEWAWQRAAADVVAPAPGAAEFLGKGALLTAELAGGLAHEGLRNIAGLEAQAFIPEVLRGGELSPGGVVPPFLVPPQLQQDVSREPPTETLERLPRSVQLGLEATAVAPFFGPGLAAEMGVGSIVGGEIGERTPIGRGWGEAGGLLGGPLASRGILGPAVRGLTTRAPGAVKPMTEADILGSRFTDVAGGGADIPAGARGTAGELQAMQETAAEYGTKLWAGTATEGFAAGLREPDIIAGGALTRLTTIIKQLKPLRAETEVEKSAALRQKVGAVRDIQAQRMGEAGFYRGRGALRGPTLPERPTVPEPGGMVWAGDRNNLGRVQSLSEDGRTAEVFFKNRETGARATVTLDTSILTPVGGEVRGQFSQIEIDAMIDHALKHPAANARPLEAENARAALVDTLGGQLPTTGEIALLEKYFGVDLAKAVSSNRPLGQRAWETTVDLLNLPRTLMASMDVSFPFRQGIMVATRHPKEWLGNFPNMFKGGFSSRRAQLIDEAMDADATIIQTTKGPRALSELASDSGLYRAPIQGYGPLEAREEFFLSNLAKRLPIIGRGVKFSERAFITYSNKLRQDIFKNTLQSWAGPNGKPVTPENARALADMLNRMTGRGTLSATLPGGLKPSAEALAPFLSAGFFAPRFAVSRPQAFMQLFNYQNPRVAYQAAQEIVSFVALGTSVLSLLKLSGAADVELDPRSADFGKVKIGNTRIDFWGGNLQWARLVAQLQQGKRKTSTGTIVPISRIDAAIRTARFKGSPPSATVVDWSLGETAVGQTFPPTGLGFAGEGDITTEVFRRTAPMAMQDFVEAILEHDATGGFLGALAFGGIGVQTYETRAQAFERVTGKSYDETPPKLRQQIIRETPELQRFEPGGLTEGQQITMSFTEKLMPLAQAVLAGTPGAAKNYQENRPNIMAGAAGAKGWVFRDMDIKPIGRDNELLDQYYDVNFLEDLDGNGIPGDDEDVRMALEAQDKLKKQLSPAVRKAMDNPENFFPDEDVIAVEKRRDLAVDRIRHLIDNIPKYEGKPPSDYEGTHVEYCEEVDEFVRYTLQQWEDAKHKHGEGRFSMSQPDAAIYLGKEQGKEEMGRDAATVLGNKVRWDSEYNQFLIDNQEAIAPFFPGMYQRKIFRDKGVLTDEIWKEVNLPIQPPGVPTMPQAEAAFKS